jgi:hypothetical protein
MNARAFGRDLHCVAQRHEAVVHEQLQVMNKVCQTAELTIVAAAGDNSSSGLPGAGKSRGELSLPTAMLLATCRICYYDLDAAKAGF